MPSHLPMKVNRNAAWFKLGRSILFGVLGYILAALLFGESSAAFGGVIAMAVGWMTA